MTIAKIISGFVIAGIFMVTIVLPVLSIREELREIRKTLNSIKNYTILKNKD